MKITQLHVYPIKSLRGISLDSSYLGPQGFAFDRRYVLVRLSAKGNYEKMFVGNLPEMALFHCSTSTPSTFEVSYHRPSPPITKPTHAQETKLEIPYEPKTTGLKEIRFDIHTDPNYRAYCMPESINAWFSECFGYKVILAYMGDVYGVPKQDTASESWFSTLGPKLSSESLQSINFSNGAPVMVVSETSLVALQPRLEGEEVILEKFRPNIVISDPALPAWDEDFWGELVIPHVGARIIMTSNCARCTSINVDLKRGTMAKGESGQLLKKMMKDRRVDPGNKWSPIFGRYGFPTSGGIINVGDEILVSIRNTERTVWNGIMPRLSKFAKDETTTRPTTMATSNVKLGAVVLLVATALWWLARCLSSTT